MHKVVIHEADRNVFQSIWTTVWKEEGYEIEPSAHTLAQVLVFNEANVPVGTFELKPYHFDGSPLNEIAPFREQAEITADPCSVAEVDKVALLREYRGPNVSRLLSSIVHYSRQYNIVHCACLMEPVFARALRISFHVPMRQVGKKTYYKGDDVVPTLIHVGDIWHDPESYPWYISMSCQSG
ncbi:hypothetical protein M3650_11620 [Paenibacillus sp. MER TA 81-3]|uniref:hypothetical protein n=1 Tax=Paenibacillus sp. MER TA 81-3 TaxID=2939573 RepID=UPI00203F10F2|nr:hypothetical protein [Paenibacillus sp. MER TA 81-3]MCM3339265.1 hypothetical protein [Paenibacillus sp. MER TA 81-3]